MRWLFRNAHEHNRNKVALGVVKLHVIFFTRELKSSAHWVAWSEGDDRTCDKDVVRVEQGAKYCILLTGSRCFSVASHEPKSVASTRQEEVNCILRWTSIRLCYQDRSAGAASWLAASIWRVRGEVYTQTVLSQDISQSSYITLTS